MPSVYLGIGNSDDGTDNRLSQRGWSDFIKDVDDEVASIATEALRWFSAPDDPWQSAVWLLHFKSNERLEAARKQAIKVRERYIQRSVAWTIADTTFI